MGNLIKCEDSVWRETEAVTRDIPFSKLNFFKSKTEVHYKIKRSWQARETERIIRDYCERTNQVFDTFISWR